jgi:hypothetical protein
MLTDAPPHNADRAGYLESDRIRTLDLPQNCGLPTIANSIESAMKAGKTADVRRACAEFLAETLKFYQTPSCDIRVLAARPLRVRENWTIELFRDYHPETMLIRLWMRTAVRKEITSFGTFLNTLCHKFCHHLDFTDLASPTRGTHGVSTSVRLRFTIMHEERRPNGSSGCQYREDAGESTGLGRIAVGERCLRCRIAPRLLDIL